MYKNLTVSFSLSHFCVFDLDRIRARVKKRAFWGGGVIWHKRDTGVFIPLYRQTRVCARPMNEFLKRRLFFFLNLVDFCA
jgi:hypothetical protein